MQSLIYLFSGASVTVMIPRSRFLLSFVMLLILGITLSLFPIQDYDIWFHLATGRYIIENLTVPHYDLFSHTAPSARWITHEWLTEVIFFVIFHVSGINGLIILKVTIMCLIAAGLYLLAIRLACSPEVSLAISSVCMFMITFRAFVRPHILTELFMVLLLVIVYGFPQWTRKHGIIFIPILMLIWSNLHSGVLLGYIVLCVILGSCSLKQGSFCSGPSLPAKTTGYLLLFSGLAMLCNPNHIEGLLYPILFIEDPFFFKVISELQPILAPEYAGADFLIATWILIAIWLLTFVFSKKRFCIDELMLFGIWIFWAFKANRNVPLLAICTVPAILRRLGSIRLPARFFSFRIVRISAALVIYFALIVTIHRNISLGVNLAKDGYRKPGWGLASLKYPQGAAQFLNHVSFPGTMFNDFSFGGYLIWACQPLHPVFIDGRLDVYPSELFDDYAGVFRGTVKVDELVSRYNIDHFVIAYPSRDSTGVSALHQELSSSGKWTLIYWDDNSLIYAAQNQTTEALIEQHGYHHINPLKSRWSDMDSQIKESPDALILEANRALDLCPECTGPNVILGRVAELARDYASARKFYDRTLELKPDHSAVAQQLGYVLLQLKDYRAAESIFRDLIRDNPKDPLIHLNLGVTLHHLNKQHEALSEYLQSYSLKPNHFDTNVNLGIAFAELGQFDRARFHWEQALKINPDALHIRQNLERIRQK